MRPLMLHTGPQMQKTDTLTRSPLGQPQIKTTDPCFLRVQTRVRLAWFFLRTATLSPCPPVVVPLCQRPRRPLLLQAHAPVTLRPTQ